MEILPEKKVRIESINDGTTLAVIIEVRVTKNLQRTEVNMVDVSSKGLRCRAVQEIPDRRGMIVPLTEGTVMYELDGNLKNLINVHWDDGFASLVGPDSIEIIDSAVTWN